MNERITIGRLAKLAGVNIQTVRYYERRGILTPSSKTGVGYRIYGDPELRRLQFIRHAKELGFTLKEIADLLQLGVPSESSCDSVRKKAEEKLRIVEERMEALGSMKLVLEELIRACRGRKRIEECPILKSIEKGGGKDVKKKKGRGLHGRLSRL